MACMSGVRSHVAVLAYATATAGPSMKTHAYDSGQEVWNGMVHLITSRFLPASTGPDGIFHPQVLLCPAEQQEVNMFYNNMPFVIARFRNGLTTKIIVQYAPVRGRSGSTRRGCRCGRITACRATIRRTSRRPPVSAASSPAWCSSRTRRRPISGRS